MAYEALISQYLAATWILTILAVGATLMRLYARFKIAKNAGWDDAIMAFCAILSIGAASTYTATISDERGSQFIPPPMLKATSATSTFVLLAVVFPKVGVAALLIRLLNPSKLMSILLLGLTTIGVIAGIATIVALFEACPPPPLHEAQCVDADAVIGISLWAGSFAAFLDFFLALYPSWVFWRLQMSLKKKVGVSCLMSLGVIAGSVAIYKNATLANLSVALDFRYFKLQLVTIVEANLAILAASIPTLKPCFVKPQTTSYYTANSRQPLSRPRRLASEESTSQRSGEDDRIELTAKHPDPDAAAGVITKQVDMEVRQEQVHAGREGAGRQYGLYDPRGFTNV